jgi:hypothetical protein
MACVNVGTLALVINLRKQIKLSVENLFSSTNQMYKLDTAGEVQDDEAGLSAPREPPPTPSSGPEQGWLSHAQIRRLAKEDQDGFHFEQASRILALRKIELERIIVCFVLSSPSRDVTLTPSDYG